MSNQKLSSKKLTDKTLIIILKTAITIGICLIMLGIYLHNFSDAMEALGVKGIIISAFCVAFGMVLSLPTKMYLTLVLVNLENHQRELEHQRELQQSTHQNQSKDPQHTPQ